MEAQTGVALLGIGLLVMCVGLGVLTWRVNELRKSVRKLREASRPTTTYNGTAKDVSRFLELQANQHKLNEALREIADRTAQPNGAEIDGETA